MAKIFWLLISIFSVSSVVQASIGQINDYISSHSFLELYREGDVSYCSQIDTNIIETGNNRVIIGQDFLIEARTEARNLASSLCYYYNRIRGASDDVSTQWQLVDDDMCNVHKVIRIPFGECQGAITRYLENSEGEFSEDLTSIQQNLSRMEAEPKDVKNIADLHKHIDLFIVVTALWGQIGTMNADH